MQKPEHSSFVERGEVSPVYSNKILSILFSINVEFS
jgi:hypothetical protein